MGRCLKDTEQVGVVNLTYMMGTMFSYAAELERSRNDLAARRELLFQAAEAIEAVAMRLKVADTRTELEVEARRFRQMA
jgi:hypothetical protein